MLQLLLVALSTFTILVFLLGLLPFRVHAKLMPALTTGIAWGMYDIRHTILLLLLSAAAVAALVSRWALGTVPEPWQVNDVLGWLYGRSRPRRKGPEMRPPRRVPPLP